MIVLGISNATRSIHGAFLSKCISADSVKVEAKDNQGGADRKPDERLELLQVADYMCKVIFRFHIVSACL